MCRVVLGCECSAAESTREEHGSHALVHTFPVPPPAHARAARRGRHHHAVVFLHQHEKRKEKRRGGGRSYGYESPCAARRSSWPSPTPQVQPLRVVTLRSDMSSSQQYPAGVPGAPPGGATTLSSVAKSTDLTAATRSMRRQQKRKGKTHLGGHVLHGCAGAPRRGIARGHLGDGGHDADAPDLPAQRRQLPAALPESGVRGQGDEAHLPGGGGEQPGDHYPYGGERVVSAEQTPRKGMIWSRMTASAVAIGARLKGCDLTEPRGAGLRVQGSAAVICPFCLGTRCPSWRLHRCAAELSEHARSGETALR